MKNVIITLVSLFFMTSLFAHDGGHGAQEIWIVNNEPILAEYLKFEDNKVFLVSKNHELLSYSIDDFSPKYQELILKRYNATVRVNEPLHYEATDNSKSYIFLITGLLSITLLVVFIVLKANKYAFIIALVICSFLTLLACSSDDIDNTDAAEDNVTNVPANDVSFLSAIFGNFPNVSTESDDEWFYIAGNGLPEHNMMVGITNWQQQVPIDQDFTGNNRWQIPIQPVVAETPQPMENEFFRNAIAISVNGVPLYHPMTNAGVDAFASGQLDQWGGHSGRADDYHYHLPPKHLVSTIGNDMPVAYALDGFPIYGTTTETLDANLGRYNDEGGYQYHSVDNYPYFMANLVGEVTLTETQDGRNTVYEIIPQPRTTGARPSTNPLGGTLEITDFESTGTNAYQLTYTLNGGTYLINYSWNNSGNYIYTFTNPDGSIVTETYQR